VTWVHALVRYGGFDSKGFRITVVFGRHPQKTGKKLGEFEMFDAEAMPTIIKGRGIKVTIIAAVPAAAAQAVADTLIESGVRAILNYAPITLSVPPYIQVQYIDPIIHLQHMSYYLT